jgi:hypothetical protein
MHKLLGPIIIASLVGSTAVQANCVSVLDAPHPHHATHVAIHHGHAKAVHHPHTPTLREICDDLLPGSILSSLLVSDTGIGIVSYSTNGQSDNGNGGSGGNGQNGEDKDHDHGPPSAVPIAPAVILFGSALFGLALLQRRRRRCISLKPR